MLSLVTGMIFGLMPAVHAARDRFSGALKQGGRGQTSDGGGRARRVLIVAELALALMLLVGGGLLLRTFVALQRVDLGFQSVAAARGLRIAAAGRRYSTDEARLAFYDAIRARTAALPGVTQTALTSVIPLTGDGDTDFLIEGRPVADAQLRRAHYLVSHRHRQLLRHDGDSAQTRTVIPGSRGRAGRGDQRNGGATLLAERRSDRPAGPFRATPRGRRSSASSRT